MAFHGPSRLTPRRCRVASDFTVTVGIHPIKRIGISISYGDGVLIYGTQTATVSDGDPTLSSISFSYTPICTLMESGFVAPS